MKLIYILAAVLIFGILVAVHELGHFLAAKLCGVRVNEFSIGMGPNVWSRKRGETQYSFRALPIGGFCAMEGEDEESSNGRAFCNKPAWQRFIILFAGAGMNLLLGLCLLAWSTSQMSLLGTNVVGRLEEGAASAAYLQPGDRIAQLMVTPVVQAKIQMVDELDDTARGAGGFGSTGR